MWSRIDWPFLSLFHLMICISRETWNIELHVSNFIFLSLSLSLSLSIYISIYIYIYIHTQAIAYSIQNIPIRFFYWWQHYFSTVLWISFIKKKKKKISHFEFSLQFFFFIMDFLKIINIRLYFFNPFKVSVSNFCVFFFKFHN